MDLDSIEDKPSSIENGNHGELESESNNVDSLEVVSSGGDTMREVESVAENLTKVELDIAHYSEKLINLDVLVMHVASRGSDFEAFLVENHTQEGPMLKALEFDLLSGFLDSEVTELEKFLSALHTDIVSSRKVVSSFTQLGDTFYDIKDKLHDCEDSLKQSFEQVSGLKEQSANFQRILLAFSGDEKRKDNEDVGCLENNNDRNLSAKIKTQTAEQQKSILRMLEKSLARELNLEKKLNEARETEEELKLRLQQEVFCMEQEAEDIWERLFEAENSAEILSGVSKELFGRIQLAQLSMNRLTEQGGELRSKHENLSEQNNELTEKASEADDTWERLFEAENSAEILSGVSKELSGRIQMAQLSMNRLIEREGELRSKLENFREQNNELTEKASEAEKRAEIAEAECKKLRMSNMELTTDVIHLKSSITHATNKVEQLETQLKDSEIKRDHAVASAEASQEKQSMLDCIIKDMGNLIEDLKSKVLRAESQTESAEDKCILLSESNAELTDDINFLTSRVEHLETSLQHANEAKNETAKDIRVRTKLITDLVLQLALERERLHKQISSLMKEKKVAVRFLQRVKDPSVSLIGSPEAKVEAVKLSKNNNKNGSPGKEVNLENTGSSAISYEMEGNAQNDSSKTNASAGQDDPPSEVDTTRNIDARQLKFNCVLVIVLILLIPPLTAFMLSQ
ncbi:WPP domain-interacting tail-anchored protein 1 isoform X2 [Salvia hispanica]|nr:WPP domain-interacting tail-anchored protein 1 isoform X2 [Salvia hispanica]XP_047963125.1 WPP domain-interacting tail-anchored protein 1 isoform X2 [Salvia hispanica]